MGYLYNRKYLESRRRELRNNSTSAEAALWLMLKNRQLEGRRVRRQFSVGNYILDFYCPQEKQAIELDGEYHYSGNIIERDKKRDEHI
ncbi:MAG: endonuclease domain-containing protein, partial [Cyclobacteriaceae bacterium]|nr:endonuclease domain-containing protein [Cyclobacteriaceae bacterium]